MPTMRPFSAGGRLSRALRTAAIGWAWAASGPSASPARAQLPAAAPGPEYYVAIEQLFAGEYRDAERGFAEALRGARKTVNARWMDSICYHAMLGETYFQSGRLDLALDQFTLACTLHLQYPQWLLRVNFNSEPRPDASRARLPIPWGASRRQATLGVLPDSMLVSIGTIDTSQQVQRGGVVTQAQFWPLNVVEVLRATALAVRRRNELLGPLGPHDAVSKRLVAAFDRGAAPPNHWSHAWIAVLRGLALAGVGQREEALAQLEQGQVLAGTFDHGLTGVSLVEQGRLRMEGGAGPEAGEFFTEASYSAFYYNDLSVLDDALRWGVAYRLAHGIETANPALATAAAWARRNRLDHLAGRAQLGLADELLAVRRGSEAAAAWQSGQPRLRDAAQGPLGTYALWLAARIELPAGRGTATEKLETALQRQAAMSPRNLQIALANRLFDAQTLPSRTALDAYAQLLGDPSPSDVAVRLLDALAVIRTPHRAAFDRWMSAALERDDLAAALDVADRDARRRFHQSLPLAGRVAAVRRLAAAPAADLGPEERAARNDLLLAWPALDEAIAEADACAAELGRLWQPADDKQQLAANLPLWRDYRQALDLRERSLAAAALDRIPAAYAFPPPLPADWRKRFAPGEAALVFHDSPAGMLALLFTAQDAAVWNCGPTAELAARIGELLRALGNNDGNREVSVAVLQSDAWRKPAAELFDALFAKAPLDIEGLDELVVVPDGVLWYAPFEALQVRTETYAGALSGIARVRYAPTLGLAFRFREPWRRVQRAAVVVGALLPGDDQEQRVAAVQPLLDAIDNALAIPPGPPATGPVAASLIDALVNFEEIEVSPDAPYGWSPLALDRSASRESLGSWLGLPGVGPQRVVLPGLRTAAERGGRAARRGDDAEQTPGDELFLSACALMAAGSETLLLSRWHVGGQSTVDFVREFLQEAPHTSASDAWQRCLQLAAEWPVDPTSEPRLKAPPQGAQLTAAHPFFWAGYLLVDSGWRGPPAEPPAPAAPPLPGAAPPAPPAVPPARPLPPGTSPPDSPPPGSPAAGSVAKQAAAVGSPPPPATPPAAGRSAPRASAAPAPPPATPPGAPPAAPVAR